VQLSGPSSLGADAGITGFSLSSRRSGSHQLRPSWAGCLGGEVRRPSRHLNRPHRQLVWPDGGSNCASSRFRSPLRPSHIPPVIAARARKMARSLFFLPPAHRGARVIGTDALRITMILREPSDGQERKQDSEDDPDINAHQSSPAVALPTNSSLTDPLWSTPLSGRSSCANRIGTDQTVFVLPRTHLDPVGEHAEVLADRDERRMLVVHLHAETVRGLRNLGNRETGLGRITEALPAFFLAWQRSDNSLSRRPLGCHSRRKTLMHGGECADGLPLQAFDWSSAQTTLRKRKRAVAAMSGRPSR
jgi:hypothetical protein